MIVDKHIAPDRHIPKRDAVKELDSLAIRLREIAGYVSTEDYVERLIVDLGELQYARLWHLERRIQLGGGKRGRSIGQTLPSSGEPDFELSGSPQPVVQRLEANEMDGCVAREQNALRSGYAPPRRSYPHN